MMSIEFGTAVGKSKPVRRVHRTGDMVGAVELAKTPAVTSPERSSGHGVPTSTESAEAAAEGRAESRRFLGPGAFSYEQGVTVAVPFAPVGRMWRRAGRHVVVGVMRRRGPRARGPIRVQRKARGGTRRPPC